MDTSNTHGHANLRLRYNYRPDSDLYIIYNVGTQSPALPRQPSSSSRDSFRCEMDLFVRAVKSEFKRHGFEPAGECDDFFFHGL